MLKPHRLVCCYFPPHADPYPYLVLPKPRACAATIGKTLTQISLGFGVRKESFSPGRIIVEEKCN